MQDPRDLDESTEVLAFDDTKKGGGSPRGPGACQEGYNVCQGNAERLYDDGQVTASNELLKDCIQTGASCTKLEDLVQTNIFSLGGRTDFPPNRMGVPLSIRKGCSRVCALNNRYSCGKAQTVELCSISDRAMKHYLRRFW
jgi:hypothetical protein